MSSTSMTSTNALTVKKWALSDWINMGQHTAFGHMANRGVIYYVDEFIGQRARGDQVTYDYTQKLTGIPVGEGGTLDGNEEALNLGSYTMAMNVTRLGVLNPNSDTIEQQRTLVDFPAKSRIVIPNRHKELIDTSIFYQLAGSNPNVFTINGTTWSGSNKTFVQGHNPIVAPSPDRLIRVGGGAGDENITSSNTMTLDVIDYVMERNAISDQPIEPLADGTFDGYFSPEQIVDLKQDTTGKIQWFQPQLAKMAGDQIDYFDKPLYKGLVCLGMYNRVNIYEAGRVAYGVNSATGSVITSVRRAVIVGKDALSFASPFGGGRISDKSVPLQYFDQLKDYGYYKGLEGRMIYGLKKTRASNSEDIGVFVVSTYAAPHS